MQINLLEGLGVEGDAHAGPSVKHRYLARRNPRMPNLRQVHLFAEETLQALLTCGTRLFPRSRFCVELLRFLSKSCAVRR
jgi:hypothetical protein